MCMRRYPFLYFICTFFSHELSTLNTKNGVKILTLALSTNRNSITSTKSNCPTVPVSPTDCGQIFFLSPSVWHTVNGVNAHAIILRAKNGRIFFYKPPDHVKEVHGVTSYLLQLSTHWRN